MKVKYGDFIEGIHQRLAHTSKGWVIKVAVICNKAENALTSLIDLPLRKPNEFYIVILQPLWIFLSERLSINYFVILDLIYDPIALVGRVT